MKKTIFFLLTSFLIGSVSHGAGLLQTVWACNIPCQVKGTQETLKDVQVSYCSVSSLSEKMIHDMDSVCQKQNNRADAIAIRTSQAQYATCVSAGNTCATEGLTNAVYTCNFMCASQDQVVHKFTACAQTGADAWSNASSVCAGATVPDKSIYSQSDVCTAEGQTSCP